jgi:hypothetical protein
MGLNCILSIFVFGIALELKFIYRNFVFFKTNLVWLQAFSKKCVLVQHKKWLKQINLKNRKFRVPRKQEAHFLGTRTQIQDSWVFFIISIKFLIDRVPSCLIF